MKLKEYTLIIVACILAMAEAKWKKEVEVMMHEVTARVVKSMYTDATSGESHIVYCNQSDGHVYYTRLDKLGDTMAEVMRLTTYTRCYQVQVIGPHDGIHLYVVYEALRSINFQGCTKANLAGCDEIYIMASRDGGETWGRPTPIQESPTEALRRRGFVLVENWPAKYLWLTYTVQRGKDKLIAGIRYDTLQDAFDDELMLVSSSEEASGIHFSFATFTGIGNIILHLVYGTGLKAMVSVDDGRTWTQSEDMKQPCRSPRHQLRTITSRQKYVISECRMDEGNEISYSEDNGTTWTVMYAAPLSLGHEFAFCESSDPNPQSIHWVTLYPTRRTLTLTQANFPQHTSHQVQVPTTQFYIEGRMNLNCYWMNGKLNIRFLYDVQHADNNDNILTLYILSNHDLQATPRRTIKTDL